MNHITSPFAPDGKTKYITRIPVKNIVNKYKSFNVNTKYIFSNHKYISLLECIDSSYKFYYPFDISGDSRFYEQLQRNDWYYMPWKWEHEITLNYIKNGQCILEVGCGNGSFLEKINELYNLQESVGLELNETVKVKSKKFKVINKYIQEYQAENRNKYDIVCSYQVLEHISEVYDFIDAKIKCLKTGGKMIISVPNNDSYIKSLDTALNMPPHHMGLWNKKSLQYIEEIFPVRLLEIHYENLQKYHISGYIKARYYSHHGKVISKIKKSFDRFIGKYQKIEKEVLSNKHQIMGHTILGVYEKIS